MSSLPTALSIKLTDVLYVPWALHWFSLLRSQADTSRSTHLGYPEGTILVGGKFIHALPIKHPPKDQIIHLELSTSHEPLVVAPEHLPVACIFNSRLPSSLVDQVNILTSELVLRDFIICLTRREHMVTSGGRTTSAPYTMKKCVSPMARLGDVQLPHSAHKSSSIHFLPCFFKPS
jgi:hypothetical protein